MRSYGRAYARRAYMREVLYVEQHKCQGKGGLICGGGGGGLTGGEIRYSVVRKPSGEGLLSF